MARTEARIKTSIWTDAEWLDLDTTAKMVYFTILSQPKLNLCGVIGFTPGAWASMAKVSRAAVMKGVKQLQERDFVYVEPSTDELWVRTLAKNDGVLDKPYMVVAMSKDFGTIQSPIIIARFLEALGGNFLRQLPVQFPKVFGNDADPKQAKQCVDAFVDAFNRQFDG